MIANYLIRGHLLNSLETFKLRARGFQLVAGSTVLTNWMISRFSWTENTVHLSKFKWTTVCVGQASIWFNWTEFPSAKANGFTKSIRGNWLSQSRRLNDRWPLFTEHCWLTNIKMKRWACNRYFEQITSWIHRMHTEAVWWLAATAFAVLNGHPQV